MAPVVNMLLCKTTNILVDLLRIIEFMTDMIPAVLHHSFILLIDSCKSNKLFYLYLHLVEDDGLL